VEPVDVPLKKLEAQLTDKNIYLSTEDQLADIFNKNDQQFTVSNADGSNPRNASFEDIFNGDNNAAVDVTFEIYDGENLIESFTIPHGETSGDWASDEPPVLTSDSYTIKCVITDIKNPDNKTVGTETAKINVFKPILTYEDKNVYFKGDQIEEDSVAPVKIEWKHGDTLDSAVEMDTDKPEMTFTYGGIDEGTVDQMTDYTVSVTAIESSARDDYDLLVKAPDAVTFLRDCVVEGLDDEEASAEEAFKIHVYSPSLAFEDMEKYYGESISFTAPEADWKNGDKEAPDDMDNDKPQISVELTPENGAVNENGYVTSTNDFDVKAVVKAGEEDITSALISAGGMTRTCNVEDADCGDDLEVTEDCAFVVHVRTITLDVTKEINGLLADKTAKYAFTVTVTPDSASGLAAVTESGELGDGDKLELDALPKNASVTVTEASVPENYIVTAKVNGQDATVTGNSDKTVEAALTLDENHVIVTNTLEDIPFTGINVPVRYLEYLMIGTAFAGLALIAYLNYRKRRTRR
jgi:hypothetical protein